VGHALIVTGITIPGMTSRVDLDRSSAGSRQSSARGRILTKSRLFRAADSGAEVLGLGRSKRVPIRAAVRVPQSSAARSNVRFRDAAPLAF
jgi:hypothetical protein